MELRQLLLYSNTNILNNMSYLFAIWTRTPEDYFFIKEFIYFLNQKKIDTTLVFQKNSNLKSINFLKKNNYKEIYSSKNKFLNNIFYLYFLIYFALLVVIKKPKIVYLFNSHSLMSVIFFKIFFSGKIIYHNFDYNPYSKSFSQKIITFFEKYLSQYLEILIFSNKNRGMLFRKLSKFKKIKILTIYNCLSKKNIKYKFKSLTKKKLLFRIGSIGPNHSLENLIISLKYLSNDYELMLCGKITDKGYYNHLKQIIKLNNLSSKVKIKTSVTSKYWNEKLAKASLGIALYDSNKGNISHKYMCGASQKINAYLSSSLPILLSNEKQFVDFQNKYKCCINTDSKNPYEISKSIKNIFLSNKKYNRLRKNSYKAFVKEFNFEKQIDKIKNYI